MSSKERLIKRLMSTADGTKLENIKFSLGFSTFRSEEDFCSEILRAEEQIAAGLVEPVSASHIDGKFKSRTVEEFLA